MTAAQETVYFERLGGIETRMDNVEKTIEGHGTKIDAVLTAVSGHRPFDGMYVLKFIALAAAILASGGAAVTYVAASINAPRLAVLEYRMNAVQPAGNWTVATENIR